MGKNTVLITGTSRGIGLDIALECYKKGYEVIGLSSKKVTDTKWKHYDVDLSNTNSKDKLTEIINTHKPCRFVGNAGLLISGRLEDVNSHDFSKLMNVNLLSLMETVKLLKSSFEKEKFGRIVLIGSRAALGKENRILYGSSKAAVNGLCRSLALELAERQVTVNVIAPGPIETVLFNQGQPVGSKAREKLESSIPMKRVGIPKDIANAANFFLSDESGYVTGQILHVCGGLSVGFNSA